MIPLPRKLLAGFTFVFLIMLPAAVFSDVKIVLKNGRSITAEGCQEKAGELVCSRAGGFFSIEKADIARIKDVPGGMSSTDQAVMESPSEEGVPAEVQTDKKGGSQKVTAERKELERKLADITQRQKELKAEGAKLAKEREQLRSSLKKAPDWMTVQQHNEFSKRIADLDKRIKRYSEEVSRLNSEGKRIAGQLNAGSAQPPKQAEGD